MLRCLHKKCRCGIQIHRTLNPFIVTKFRQCQTDRNNTCISCMLLEFVDMMRQKTEVEMEGSQHDDVLSDAQITISNNAVLFSYIFSRQCT